MLKKMKIKYQIFIFSGLIASMFIIISFNGYLSNKKLTENMTDIYNDSLKPITQLNLIQSKLTDINGKIWFVFSSLNKLQRNRIVFTLNDKTSEIENLIDIYKNNKLDDEEKEMVNILIKEFNIYKKHIDSVIKENNNEKAYNNNLKKVDSSLTTLTVLLSSMIDKAKEKTEKSRIESLKLKKRTDSINIIIGLVSILITLILSFIISSMISKPITIVSNKLTDIAERENVDLDTKLITDNKNEIGVLVDSFNKIRKKFKKQLTLVEQNHNIIIEQEKLASLGSIAAGIAHNLKTPILIVDSNSQSIKNLTKEIKDSLGDDRVTEEDFHEIADDINKLVDKTRNQIDYMSKIISTVKNQAVKSKSYSVEKFTIDEIFDKVKLLMNYTLTKKMCVLNKEIIDLDDLFIEGNGNDLIQVINNLVNNAIEAYDENGGEINFKAYVKENNICIEVKDFGSGIDENVQKKLFKENVTTKGKYGTGIGLYISYSNLKAHFKGDIKFVSEKNKGTTFYIYLPLSLSVNNSK